MSNQHSAPDRQLSTEYKNAGNTYFAENNLAAAEAFYGRAILADITNPDPYTNRARVRVMLNQYESAAEDCRACLKLNPLNTKAHYILATARLEMHDYDGAVKSAERAYRTGVASHDKSLSQIAELVLMCKKRRWGHRERMRTQECSELENELVWLLESQHDEELQNCSDLVKMSELERETRQKITLVRATFDESRPASEKRREVPDWLIDEISYNVMTDPVVTPSGKSYERSSILRHLAINPIDPVTRQPLSAKDLRPNLALRQACEEFLEKNGWAYDW
ncbi:U-box domain-containing protein [Astrocystis sublimbata]|nr:U-box domain-containing protein [Astrocystis sublimbata]